MLYSVWDANSSLCDSMVMKRSYVQRLQQEVKLGVVLKEQVRFVEIYDICYSIIILAESDIFYFADHWRAVILFRYLV